MTGAPLAGAGLQSLADGRVAAHLAIEALPAGSTTTAAAHDVISREPLLIAETAVRAPRARRGSIITPMNSYLLIILVVLQKYKPRAGIGSLISLMVPYSNVFFVAWTGLLLVWYFFGLPLGPDAPLHYEPAG